MEHMRKGHLVLPTLATFIFFCYGFTYIDANEKHGCQCRWIRDDRVNFEIPLEKCFLPTNESVHTNCSLQHFGILNVQDKEWDCQTTILQNTENSDSKKTSPKLDSETDKIVNRFVTSNQHQDKWVTLGNSTTLSCTFSAHAPWCYWTKDRDVIAIERGYSFIGDKIDGNCSIRISNVSMLDNGLWQCHYPKTRDQYMLKSGIITLTTIVPASAPIITLNGLKLKDGQKVYISGQWEYSGDYENYGEGRAIHTFLYNNPIDISCWSFNSHPAAQLIWTGGLLHKNSEVKITPSLYQNLYNSRIHFKFNTVFPALWQQTNVTCLVDSPNSNIRNPKLYSKEYSTSIQIILSVSGN